jgi:hypothetical protein
LALILLAMGAWWFFRRRKRQETSSAAVPEDKEKSGDAVLLDGAEVAEMEASQRGVVESDSKELPSELHSRSLGRKVLHEMPA